MSDKKPKSKLRDKPELKFKARSEWRKWLENNHDSSTGIWLVMFKQASGMPTISYDDAVEEAICFGWIDSTANSKDEKSSLLYFAPRKPKSPWSKLNKTRIDKLMRTGQMHVSGLAKITKAKDDGSWTVYDDIEALVIPQDLATELAKSKIGKANFDNFPPSAVKAILWWIKSAKQLETRQKRIKETVEKAKDNLRAGQ